MRDLPPILTVTEVAELLGCTVPTLEESHRQGRLCGVRLGNGGLRYSRDSLLRQMDAIAWASFNPSGDAPSGTPTPTAYQPLRFGAPPALPDLPEVGH